MSGVNVVLLVKFLLLSRFWKDDIVVENVEEIVGDNVKLKLFRKKKV